MRPVVRQRCHLLPGDRAAFQSARRSWIFLRFCNTKRDGGCLGTSVWEAMKRKKQKTVQYLWTYVHVFVLKGFWATLKCFSPHWSSRLQTRWLLWFLMQSRQSTLACTSTVSYWTACPWTPTHTAASSIQSSPPTLWSQSTPLLKYVVSEANLLHCAGMICKYIFVVIIFMNSL